jgi:two-component system sensor histidine kinase/response regulator
LNLLDLSRGDEGRLVPNKTSFDLKALVDEVLSELDVTAKTRAVALIADVNVPTISADTDLVRRMLANLVENAIRHAPRATKVQISADSKDGELELRVRDEGTGVPSEMVERIFDPFVQVASERDGSLTRSGRGLGLAFCKLVATAHGGRIWVEDAAPGAAFVVRIPL